MKHIKHLFNLIAIKWCTFEKDFLKKNYSGKSVFERPIDLITVGNPNNVNLKREVGDRLNHFLTLLKQQRPLGTLVRSAIQELSRKLRELLELSELLSVALILL